jgi:hypothetical protein
MTKWEGREVNERRANSSGGYYEVVATAHAADGFDYLFLFVCDYLYSLQLNA